MSLDAPFSPGSTPTCPPRSTACSSCCASPRSRPTRPTRRIATRRPTGWSPTCKPGRRRAKAPTPGHPMVVGHVDGRRGPARAVLRPLRRAAGRPAGAVAPRPVRPEIEDTAQGKVIRGRGASDDKGQLMTFVEACRAWQAVHGACPAASPSFRGRGRIGLALAGAVPARQRRRAARRLALICDTGHFDPAPPPSPSSCAACWARRSHHRPRQSTCIRGITAGRDQPDPGAARIIAGPARRDGPRHGEGFYDGVPEDADDLRAQWEALRLRPRGVPGRRRAQPAGERAHAAGNAGRARPARSTASGAAITGAGFKTVLPSQAHAKISCRLVGSRIRQDAQPSPRYVARCACPDCTVAFRPSRRAPAAR